MKNYLITIFFVILYLSASSQTADTVHYDKNSNVEIRTSEKINDFLNDDFYNYDNESVASMSFLKVFFNWLIDFFSFIDKGGSIFKFIFYGILLAVLMFAVVKILGLNFQSLILKSRKISTPDFEVFDEDIYGINFSEKIKNAEKSGDYKTAIRYLYIQYLKVLTDNELIEWKMNKTNKDYRNEMKKTKYFSEFKHLTLIYEHIWYGEFRIDKSQYIKYKQYFNLNYIKKNRVEV